MPVKVKRNLLSIHNHLLYRVILTANILLLFLFLACSDAESKTTNKMGTVADNFPLLSNTAIGSATFTRLPDNILIRSDNVSVTLQEIEEEVNRARANVREQLQNNLFFIAEQKFTEKVLLAESHRALIDSGQGIAGLSDSDIIQTYVSGLVKDIAPSEIEIREFYEANKALMGDMPFDRVRGQIVSFLTYQKQQEFVQDYVMNILSARSVEISNSWGPENITTALNNNVDTARSSGKPTMANFGSDSCVPCQMMIPAREAIKESFANRANVVYIHTDKDQILSSRYGIQSIPTLIFFNQQGDEEHRHVGIMSQEEMAEWLNSMLRE